MIELCMDAAKIVMPDYEYKYIDSIGSGSTDMGDLSCVMPVVHPYAAGATGTTHGNNYQITGPIAACVTSAKFQMEMLYLLLKDNAERAKGIIEKFEPMFKAKE